jgi:nucleoside-diphosphate-sugar epimerase
MQSPLNIILGGAGLIGRALKAELERAGESTVVLDLKHGFDLRERDPDEYPPGTYYWFLAWDVGGAKYIMNPARQIGILRNNLRLCERVFSCLACRDAPFTFVSTQMAGYPNAYGASKNVGEVWARSLSHGRIARLWNVYGAEPVGERTHLVSDLIWQGARGLIRLQTSGRERRQFIHACDAARALIVHRDNGLTQVDITSGVWVPVLEIARRVAGAMGARLDTAPEDGYESLIEPSNPLPGWHPEISLQDGIARIIEQMRAERWLD